jgi:ZIP family zinc transporter
VPVWVQAFLWGLVVGSGLLLGAAVAFFSRASHRIIAAVMGFGGGVLISSLSFGLMEEAFSHGGVAPASIGFLAGGALFSTINWGLARQGAKHRKRCSACILEVPEEETKGTGLALAAGALVDGIPESLIIGISLLGGVKISPMILVGFFLANFPQGLASAEGMKGAGRSPVYIFGVWTGIMIFSGVASLLGYAIFGGFPPAVIAALTALAAGGMLAMISETMIPEAFHEVQGFIGLITVTGFLAFFILIHIGP